MRGLVVWFLVVGMVCSGAAAAAENGDLESFVRDSRALVKAFAGELKGELQAAIKEGGPVHAIGVCNVKAPEIADALSEPGGRTIGRTSRRVRNPDNAPDDWEAGVLQDFLDRAAAGADLKTMETAALAKDATRPRYRYMKAIPVGQVCLTCHGADIEPELAARIRAVYPQDRATGFALGELRGAFTVSEPVRP